jgi:hypothetical protein
LQWLCHTKSNDEIEPLIKRYRDVRINGGQPKLKRYEGDGGGDRAVWRDTFSEMMDGICPYNTPTVGGLPTPKKYESDFVLLASERAADNWDLTIATDVAQCDQYTVYMSLDTENNRDETSDFTRILQLCFPSDICLTVAIISLSKLGALDVSSFSKEVRKLLHLKKVIPCGGNISFDRNWLEALGVRLFQAIDIGTLAKQHEGSHRSGDGMKALCACYLFIGVDKFGQNTDYSKDLSIELAHYCALDAKLSLALCAKLQSLIGAHDDPVQLIPTNILNREIVHFYHRNRVAAVGKLEFIGLSMEFNENGARQPHS